MSQENIKQWFSLINSCNQEKIYFMLSDKIYDICSIRTALVSMFGGVEDISSVIVEYIKCDIDINVKNSRGRTLLTEAVNNQNTMLINILLSLPEIDLTTRDNFGQSILMDAEFIGNNELCNMLLSHCQNHNKIYDLLRIQDHWGTNILMKACEHKNMYMIKRILHYIQPNDTINDKRLYEIINDTNKQGNTVLMKNIIHKNTTITNGLLKNTNLDINIQNSQGINALMLACNQSNVKLINQLCTYYVPTLNDKPDFQPKKYSMELNYDHKDIYGNTAFHYCTAYKIKSLLLTYIKTQEKGEQTQKV